jgi:hypothetical protein
MWRVRSRLPLGCRQYSGRVIQRVIGEESSGSTPAEYLDLVHAILRNHDRPTPLDTAAAHHVGVTPRHIVIQFIRHTRRTMRPVPDLHQIRAICSPALSDLFSAYETGARKIVLETISKQ